MEGPWRIECFGGLTGTLGEIVVTRFRTRRAALLLGYLAVFKGRTHPREELGTMLWPDADDGTVRARLRLALTSLRRQFEPPILPKGSVIEAVGDALRLNPRMVATDVGEFEALMSSAATDRDDASAVRSMERAVALYRGELLPGHQEDWVVAERTRLADLYESALSRLVDLCSRLERPDQALTYARKLLNLDPWREAAHCAIMRLFLDAGNPRAALRQYEALTAALEELGERPGREAQRLASMAKAAPVREGVIVEGPPDPPVSRDPSEAIWRQTVDSHLPVRLTRFFGRTEEKAHAVRWLAEGPGRLVTLTGYGGSGKTRLSVEIGYEMAAKGWSVWFVPLADVGSAVRIYDAILTTLKVGQGGDAIQELVRALSRHERPLLILDNLEHLMADAAGYVQHLLAEATDLRCIVTSRQRLALDGERELTVAPLATSADNEITAESAAQLPSVQLYVDRCQAIRPDFQISPANARQIAGLCARLEGIPLAIEIAASLSRALSPSQLIDQLRNRFDVLVSPRRDISDRQRTLRNTIAYSYDLLSPELARLFLCLSVFRGGWTVEAAEAVCPRPQREGEHRGSTFGMLDQLRERSLIETYETPEGDVRFRMLEAFREFGRERTTEEEMGEVEGARDAYFLRLAEAAYREMGTERETLSLARLRAEYDNLMHAFERALERHDPEYGIRLAVGFGQVWRSRGAVVHERTILERLLAQPEADVLTPELRMKALNLLSHASFLLCDWERCLAAEERTLEIAKGEGDYEFMAMALGGMSSALLGLRRREEALAALLQAVEHVRRSGKERRMVLLLGNLGVLYWRNGDLREAERYLREALGLARTFGADAQANHQGLNVARVLIDQGRLREGFELLAPTLDRAAKLHRAHDVVMGLAIMARYYRLAAEPERAWALVRLAGERVLPLLSDQMETYVAVEVALELVEQGRLVPATALLSCLTKQDLSAGDKQDVDAALDRCRAQLRQAEFSRGWAEGISQPVADALRRVLIHVGPNVSE